MQPLYMLQLTWFKLARRRCLNPFNNLLMELNLKLSRSLIVNILWYVLLSRSVYLIQHSFRKLVQLLQRPHPCLNRFAEFSSAEVFFVLVLFEERFRFKVWGPLGLMRCVLNNYLHHIL